MGNVTDLSVNEGMNKPATAHATRRRGLRLVQLVAALLIVLALVRVAVELNESWSFVPVTLAAAAAFVFAAVVLWTAPPDRPLLVSGALAIAASAMLALLPAFITTDIITATPILENAGYWLAISASLVLTLGVFLVGISYGVIHSRGGWTVFWIGVILAVSGMGIVTTRPVEEVSPLDILILSATQILPVAWAYMSAAFMGINRWFVRGGVVMLLQIGLTQLVAWLAPGPEVNFDNLRFGLALLEVIAWVLLILGALTLRPTHSKGMHSSGR